MGCGSSKHTKDGRTMVSSDSEDDFSEDEESSQYGYDQQDGSRKSDDNSRKSSLRSASAITSSRNVPQSESEGYHSTNRTEDELLSMADMAQGTEKSHLNGYYQEEGSGIKGPNGKTSSPRKTKYRRSRSRKPRNNSKRRFNRSKSGYESDPEPVRSYLSKEYDDRYDNKGYCSEPDNRDRSPVKKKVVKKKRKIKRKRSKKRVQRWNAQQMVPQADSALQKMAQPRKKSPERPPRVAGGKGRKGQPPPKWRPWNDPTNEEPWKFYPGEPIDW